MEENPQKSWLSEELSISKDAIRRQIKTFGKVYRSCRSVPHELTQQQTQCTVNICRQLVSNPIDDRFSRRTVTSHEKWVYYRNPDASLI